MQNMSSLNHWIQFSTAVLNSVDQQLTILNFDHRLRHFWEQSVSACSWSFKWKLKFSLCFFVCHCVCDVKLKVEKRYHAATVSVAGILFFLSVFYFILFHFLQHHFMYNIYLCYHVLTKGAVFRHRDRLQIYLTAMLHISSAIRSVFSQFIELFFHASAWILHTKACDGSCNKLL